ncbi:hypothetical protein [Streptomyces mirabilis]|uniref:hypothetical protein n=1 Tax=Streptomyces mirabilis TaxID=68239 RepID=UPI0036AC61C7
MRLASLDVASLFAGKIIRPVAEALRAVDAAFVTGIGVRDAFNAFKAIDGIDTAAVAAIEREVDLYEEIVTSCSRKLPGRHPGADGRRDTQADQGRPRRRPGAGHRPCLRQGTTGAGHRHLSA